MPVASAAPCAVRRGRFGLDAGQSALFELIHLGKRHPAPAAGQLPKGWRTQQSNSTGEWYYVNEYTGDSTYDVPTKPAVDPNAPWTPNQHASRSRERRPFALNIRTLTGDTTTLRNVASSQTVGSVTQRLCVETGGEPTLTRLLHEQRPLADRKRSLKAYGIVADAELHASPLLPALACLAMVRSKGRSRSPTSDTASPRRPARAVLPTRWT